MTNPEYIIAVEKLILKKRNIIASSYCRAPFYTLTDKDVQFIDEFLEEFKDYLK